MFAYMLDTARVNSSTIVALNQGEDPIKEKYFECTYQLVMELVKITIEMRNQVFLASNIKQKIALVLDRPVPQPELHQSDGPALGYTPKRCTMCQKALAGKDYSKKNYIPCVKILQSVSPVIMQHVRNICFEKALAEPMTMQYNIFIF